MNHNVARRLPWLAFVMAPILAVANDAPLLVRIPLTGSPADVPLPVLAHLQQADGGEYVLAETTPTALKDSGVQYQFLDHLADGSHYWLAEHPFGTIGRSPRDPLFRVLLDDGVRLLVRARDAEDLRSLVSSGFELVGLERQPLVFRSDPPRLLATRGVASMEANPLVEEMLGLVSTERLVAAMDELTGPVPTVADGAYAAIVTRHTTAGRPTQLATAYMYERFKALGLETSYHAWITNGYANVNVVGVLPGTTTPSEIVVVCAHLDSMPTGAVAPGADDNASGSLAVLTAAELFRHYSFERTVRFILFTGEEQGLYGSRAYANAALAAGDLIVAVLNLDMIAWDGNGDGLVQVHTRKVSHPGYAADRAIADVFTNVVATYALTNLVPSVRTSGITASDHYRFWYVGYPGILAIEDYGGDFNPYYHKVTDVAARINWPYFTSCVRAGVGTVAHLAGPLGRRSFDAVRVVSGPFATNSVVGHGTFIARHLEGATEADDPGDVPDTGAPVGPFTSRLDLFSRPADSNLWVDARPASSETIYFASLRAMHTDALLTTTNRLRFDFVGVPDFDAAYLVRVAVAGQYLSNGIDHACVTNLRDVVAAGGFMDLPSSLRVTNGAIYGSCEIRRLRVSRKPQLAWEPSGVPAEPLLRVQGPPGLHVVDALEWSNTLTNWTTWATVTNRVAADDLGFDTGEHPLYPETLNPPSDGTPRFYRLRRQWLSP